MQIVGVQLDIAWEDGEANHAKVAALLDAAQPQRGALIILPEMFATGFSMNVAAVAEGEEGPTRRFLSNLARELGVWVVGGVARRDDTTSKAEACRPRNEALVFEPSSGRLVARYHKIHPFFVGESTHFAAGDEVVTFDWQGMTVAPFVCYDLRFPEAFRTAVRRGAQLFVVVANWPEPRESHWVTLLRARAIENQAYVVGVNRCGSDPNLRYGGRSLVIDPRGEIVADAGRDETVISADIDVAVVEAWRRQFPALRDMRRDLW